jgi:hypothetical protein
MDGFEIPFTHCLVALPSTHALNISRFPFRN